MYFHVKTKSVDIEIDDKTLKNATELKIKILTKDNILTLEEFEEVVKIISAAERLYIIERA